MSSSKLVFTEKNLSPIVLNNGRFIASKVLPSPYNNVHFFKNY